MGSVNRGGKWCSRRAWPAPDGPRPAGSPASSWRACAAYRATVFLASCHPRRRPEQRQRLGHVLVVVHRTASSSRSRSASGPVSRSAYSTGSVCTPSRRSVPGVLPDSSESLAMSMMSSEIWNAVPTIPPSRLSRAMPRRLTRPRTSHRTGPMRRSASPSSRAPPACSDRPSRRAGPHRGSRASGR